MRAQALPIDRVFVAVLGIGGGYWLFHQPIEEYYKREQKILNERRERLKKMGLSEDGRTPLQLHVECAKPLAGKPGKRVGYLLSPCCLVVRLFG